MTVSKESEDNKFYTPGPDFVSSHDWQSLFLRFVDVFDDRDTVLGLEERFHNWYYSVDIGEHLYLSLSLRSGRVPHKLRKRLESIDEYSTVSIIVRHIRRELPHDELGRARFIEDLLERMEQDLPGFSVAFAKRLEVNELALSTRHLPKEAPEIFQGLRGQESPPEFIKRVYKQWLGKGLDRAHIRNLDPKLSTAINNWLSRPTNIWPADVDLPTRSEQNRRIIESGPDGVREHLGKFTGSELMREAGRLSAAHRDQQK